MKPKLTLIEGGSRVDRRTNVYTLEDIAARLEMPIDEIREWYCTGKLPMCTDVQPLWHQGVIEKWMASGL